VFGLVKVQTNRVVAKEKEKSREKELKQAKEIEKAYENLKAAQEQLVQQEKLASLGQLTAGIAHEIKNPLNFVNNFSELSVELVEEAKEEVRIQESGVRSDKSKILEFLDGIEMNLRKIHEHGSRADSIVKSMLEHSRGGSGKMEPTNLNELVKEFTNLSFHGMRAGKDPINVEIKFDLDESIGKVPLIAEDFSRVILNLCNNGFDAMREKLTGDERPTTEEKLLNSELKIKNYSPKLTIRTMQSNTNVTIEIEDNGPGIPEEMKDKILQPFFTTKKGTQGTGLGLSITNDIIKAHGGKMHIKSLPGEGSTFTINLDKQGRDGF
jgi:signal transduction histidine kinase